MSSLLLHRPRSVESKMRTQRRQRRTVRRHPLRNWWHPLTKTCPSYLKANSPYSRWDISSALIYSPQQGRPRSLCRHPQNPLRRRHLKLGSLVPRRHRHFQEQLQRAVFIVALCCAALRPQPRPPRLYRKWKNHHRGSSVGPYEEMLRPRVPPRCQRCLGRRDHGPDLPSRCIHCRPHHQRLFKGCMKGTIHQIIALRELDLLLADPLTRRVVACEYCIL